MTCHEFMNVAESLTPAQLRLMQSRKTKRWRPMAASVRRADEWLAVAAASGQRAASSAHCTPRNAKPGPEVEQAVLTGIPDAGFEPVAAHGAGSRRARGMEIEPLLRNRRLCCGSCRADRRGLPGSADVARQADDADARLKHRQPRRRRKLIPREPRSQAGTWWPRPNQTEVAQTSVDARGNNPEHESSIASTRRCSAAVATQRIDRQGFVAADVLRSLDLFRRRAGDSHGIARQARSLCGWQWQSASDRRRGDRR